MNYLKNKINSLQKQCIKSNTLEWFKIREKKISGTNISTIINIDNYKNANQLLNDKIHGLNKIDNIFTRHGNKFENIAINILEKKLNINIQEIGFKLSDKYNFLGATPDGITIFNNEICLVEIKCPLTRKISGIPSFNYYTQIQTQLEVFNLDKCLFFECNLKEITKDDFLTKKYISGYDKDKNIYWKLEESSLNIIKKDISFMNYYINDIKKFYNHLQYKKPIKNVFSNNNFYTKKYIKNYMINNKCDVWLDLYGKKYYNEYYENNLFSNEILSKSIEKKRIFYDIIKNIAYQKNLKIVTIPSYNCKNDYLLKLTNSYMEQNYDIIINPHFYDSNMNIFSNPTLIVNNNSLHDVFNISNNNNSGYTLFNKVIKNIKFINNGSILSNDLIHSYYKTCNNVDNYVLNQNQKYNNNKSYIIGEKWNYLDNNTKIISSESNDFSKIGVVTLNSYRDLKKNLLKYINWINDIKKKDDKYIIINDKTYSPFLSTNEQSNWNKLKKNILKNQNDVIMMYGIGNILKKKINNLGIISWNDPKFYKLINYSNILNLSSKNINIINNILKLNLNSNDLIYPPNKTYNIEKDLQKKPLEIFCDFETINDFLGNENIIYLIGMTIKFPDNSIKYEYFFADNNTNECEKIIIDDFIDRINELEEKYDTDSIIYCWSKAENNFIKKFNKKNNFNYHVQFTDLLEILKNNSILVKNNIYGFGLKNYVEAMYDHKMIKKNYKDGDCDSGDKSIINAIKYYNDNDNKCYNDLIKYNEIDCTVMYEILTFFRNFYNIS